MIRIKRTAYDLYKSFNTSSPFKICKKLNINIFELELTKNVNGFYFTQGKEYTIIINKTLDSKSKSITCAHELGHVLLHKNSNFYKLKEENELIVKYEMEADYFCACLLLIEFEKLYKSKIKNMSIKEISQITKLPKRLISIWLNKLKDLK